MLFRQATMQRSSGCIECFTGFLLVFLTNSSPLVQDTEFMGVGASDAMPII